MGSTCNIQGSPNIILETTTWSRDSYGLFDYESGSGTKHKFTIKNACKLTRKGGIIEMKEISEDPDRTSGSIKKELAKIGLYNSHYWIYNSACEEEKESQEPLYLSLRNYGDNSKVQGARLLEGDIIKLGKCKFEIQEIVDHIDHNDINLDVMDNDPVIRHSKSLYNADQESNVSESKDLESQELEPKGEEKKDIEENHCRICLGEENTAENPLFKSPCKCMGSIQLIHVNCLKQWLDSKVIRKKTSCTETYSWKHFECDVCKARYPDAIMGPDNTPLTIFTINKPSNNYMMMRSLLSPTSHSNNMVQIIHLNKKKVIRIGRGPNNELRINDISVSREHAELKIRKGKIYLADRKAKYGTLLFLQRPFLLNPASQHHFQAGRTVLFFSQVKSNCPCMEQKASQIPDYTPTIKELSSVPNVEKKTQATPEEAHAIVPQYGFCSLYII